MVEPIDVKAIFQEEAEQHTQLELAISPRIRDSARQQFEDLAPGLWHALPKLENLVPCLSLRMERVGKNSASIQTNIPSKPGGEIRNTPHRDGVHVIISRATIGGERKVTFRNRWNYDLGNAAASHMRPEEVGGYVIRTMTKIMCNRRMLPLLTVSQTQFRPPGF